MRKRNLETIVLSSDDEIEILEVKRGPSADLSARMCPPADTSRTHFMPVILANNPSAAQPAHHNGITSSATTRPATAAAARGPWAAVAAAAAAAAARPALAPSASAGLLVLGDDSAADAQDHARFRAIVGQGSGSGSSSVSGGGIRKSQGSASSSISGDGSGLPWSDPDFPPTQASVDGKPASESVAPATMPVSNGRSDGGRDGGAFGGGGKGVGGGKGGGGKGGGGKGGETAAPLCRCGKPAARATVSSATPNHGRPYWRCRTRTCALFAWCASDGGDKGGGGQKRRANFSWRRFPALPVVSDFGFCAADLRQVRIN